ncbi:MAG: helix-turn-helix transcriptional regulator [Nitrospirae bacterium]|nr:helix-turn-helix transcriptional regulator [Nitrospirota bacterium]
MVRSRGRAKAQLGNRSLETCSRSECPIANALDILGDRWTLLVVRDLLFLNKRRFAELWKSPERIPTNLLADRLKRLEEAGIIARRPYQRRPVRHEYELTRKGRDLFPVLREMIRWSNKHIPETTKPPPGFLEAFERKDRGRKRNPRQMEKTK